MYRPVKPWSAKDAGAFFLKFYNITLLLAAIIFYVALFVRTSHSYLKYVSAPCHPCAAMAYENKVKLFCRAPLWDDGNWSHSHYVPDRNLLRYKR